MQVKIIDTVQEEKICLLKNKEVVDLLKAIACIHVDIMKNKLKVCFVPF